MNWAYLILSFLVVGGISACAEKKHGNLSQYQWKNRIILTYPSSEEDWKKQLQSMQAAKNEIDDRDLLILRLDQALDQFSNKERFALIKKYKLTPGTHVLIGKDGFEKSRQKGVLNLEPYFKLIDTMPMRKKEMNR